MLQISRRPLSASNADAALFVGRTRESKSIIKALRLGFNVLLLGESKSGRTSFLHQLERQLTKRKPIFVDLQRYALPFEKVLAIRAALGEDIRKRPRYERVLEEEVAEFAGLRKVEKDPVIDESDIAKMAAASPEARIVLLDNADPAFTHLVFGRFRDVLWQYSHQWVISGEVGRRMEYLRPPADAFFDAVIELSALTKQEALDLLRKRVDTAKGTTESAALRRVMRAIVESVPELTPGQLLAAARFALMNDRPPGDALAGVAAMQQRAAELGRNAAMLFAEVESLGPVHAGDERLLQRLGFTRPRVVQLLKKLEHAGLVTARSEGRRRMYEIARPGQAVPHE